MTDDLEIPAAHDGDADETGNPEEVVADAPLFAAEPDLLGATTSMDPVEVDDASWFDVPARSFEDTDTALFDSAAIEHEQSEAPDTEEGDVSAPEDAELDELLDHIREDHEDETEDDEVTGGRIGLWVAIGLAIGALVAAGVLGYAWWYTNERPIMVPALVGKLPAQAVQLLNDSELRVGSVTEEATETVTAGTVLGQRPKAGSRLTPGSAVSIVVAAAPLDAKVPTVVGKLPADALSILAASRLVGNRVEAYDASGTIGQVSAQMPAPGTHLEPGSQVTFFVSKGSPAQDKRVPLLRGLGEADAKTLIDSSGLRSVIVRSIEPSVSAGTVIDQSASADRNVPWDSVVLYRISKGAGSATVKVPSITGISRKDAAKKLSALGLTSVVTTAPSTTVARGQVMTQLPISGTKVGSAGEVGFIVSGGSAISTTVPDLTGMDSATASATLGLSNLSGIEISTPVKGAQVGTVLMQYPSPLAALLFRLPVYFLISR